MFPKSIEAISVLEAGGVSQIPLTTIRKMPVIFVVTLSNAQFGLELARKPRFGTETSIGLIVSFPILVEATFVAEVQRIEIIWHPELPDSYGFNYFCLK